MFFLFLDIELAITSLSPGTFYQGLKFRHQNLGARCAHVQVFIVSRPFQWTQLENIYFFKEKVSPCEYSQLKLIIMRFLINFFDIMLSFFSYTEYLGS